MPQYDGAGFPVSNADASLDVTVHNGATRGLYLGGVLLTATAAELNTLSTAPAAAITDISNTATGTEIADAVNAILAALRTHGIVTP